jgi:hypothetical protein
MAEFFETDLDFLNGGGEALLLRQLDHHLRFVMVSRAELCEPAANVLTN